MSDSEGATPEVQGRPGDGPGRRRERVVTMQDVAVETGVSVSTVSRALRDDSRVAAATIRRVREAAAHLDFRLNENASRLRHRTTEVVALVIPAINDWYFATLMAGAQQVLAGAGYDTVVAVATGEGPLQRILHDAKPAVSRVDAAIVIDLTLPDGLVAEQVEAGTTVVTTGRALPYFSSVMIDDIAVGRLATSHLVGLGHERIGVIGGAGFNPYGFAVPERRRQGHQLALDEAGLAPSDQEVAGNFAMAGGYDAANELLDRGGADLTAILGLSDKMAIGAMVAVEDRGLRIPDDLSIIGIDDHELAERFGLTTVRQPVARIGEVAAELVLQRVVDGDEQVEHRTLETEMVVRSSTRRRR